MICPWILMISVGVLDWGFYNYALISVEAATRSAALYTSTSTTTQTDTSGACTIVANELASLPNVDTSCSNNNTVTLGSANGPDGASASQVTVQYTTPSLIPIPGLLEKKATISFMLTMRLRS